MKLTVRPATEADEAAVLVLLAELVPVDDPARFAAFYREAIQNPRYEIMVATADGRVVGLVTVTEIPALHVAGSIAVLNELVVAPEYRRGGVGRALVEAVKAAARQRGCAALEFSNALAQKAPDGFFARAGFAREGVYYRRAL